MGAQWLTRGGHESLDFPFQSLPLPDLAFPQDQHGPALFLQRSKITLITATVIQDLRAPIAPIGFRLRGKLARMTVPKAAVHEDDLVMLGENDIRFPWKV